jgi:hypothetical protein
MHRFVLPLRRHVQWRYFHLHQHSDLQPVVSRTSASRHDDVTYVLADLESNYLVIERHLCVAAPALARCYPCHELAHWKFDRNSCASGRGNARPATPGGRSKRHTGVFSPAKFRRNSSSVLFNLHVGVWLHCHHCVCYTTAIQCGHT